MPRNHHWNILNIIILFIGIAIAVFLLKSDFLQNLISRFSDFKYIGVFLSGFFFASGFTVAPATIAILILSKSMNPLILALLGGLGAITADYLLFSLIKKEEKSSSDFRYLVHKSGLDKLKSWKARHRWLLPMLAGIIYITPLPDEIADAMFEIAHYRAKKFLPIVYILHVIGIFIIAFIGSAV